MSKIHIEGSSMHISDTPTSTPMHEVEVEDGKGDLCREIMGDLPEWFAEKEAIEACAKLADDLPMLACMADDEVVGVLALRPHPPAAMEILVVAARRRFHRRGIGRRLVAAAERVAVSAGYRLLTVKTLAPREAVEPQFEATRAFYDRSGFIRAEIFPILWHPEHPCLYFVKPIGKASP